MTFLSFWGKEKLSTHGNLLDAMQSFDRRCVVDTHIDWIKLTGLPQNANTAFIIGTTVDHEIPNLKALLLKRDGSPKARQNIFHFGMKSPTTADIRAGHTTPMLVIVRHDPELPNLLDMDALFKFDAKRAAGKIRWDNSQSIVDEKGKILSVLGLEHIDAVRQLECSREKADELQAFIDVERSRCYKDFWKSNDVIRRAYARLLLCTEKARGEFQKPDYTNLFGDCHLIQNAMFLNAAVLSRDKDVKKMARFCHVPCSEVPT